MLTEKEKLQEELKLLEESLKLDVITKGEFDNAKQKVEAKLKDLESIKEESKEQINGDDFQQKYKQDKPAEAIHVKKVEAEPIKDDDFQPEYSQDRTYEDVPEKKEEAKVKEEIKREEKVIAAEEKAAEVKKEEPEIKITELTDESEKRDDKQKKLYEEAGRPREDATIISSQEPEPVFNEDDEKSSKLWVFILILLALGFVSGYFIFSDGDEETVNGPLKIIDCMSDDDCTEDGKQETCNNPGSEGSECIFIEDVKVHLKVLNSDRCFNCRTERVVAILMGFFSNLDIEEIDYDTEEGNELAENYEINVLPAYIMDSSVTESSGYDEFANAFEQVNEEYILKSTVANSNFFIDRKETPNKLNLFVIGSHDASIKAEENLREFLEVFEGKVEYNKIASTSSAARELGLNTFPTFLLNDIVKFDGVQSADKIRENFCKLNEFEECDHRLSKSLI